MARLRRAELTTARWRRLRRVILARDGWECQACGKLLGMAEVDHIAPVGQGGAVWDPENLQVLCPDCHVLKTHEDMADCPILSVRRG